MKDDCGNLLNCYECKKRIDGYGFLKNFRDGCVIHAEFLCSKCWKKYSMMESVYP